MNIIHQSFNHSITHSANQSFNESLLNTAKLAFPRRNARISAIVIDMPPLVDIEAALQG